jgi:hypothetical protein
MMLMRPAIRTASAFTPKILMLRVAYARGGVLQPQYLSLFPCRVFTLEFFRVFIRSISLLKCFSRFAGFVRV